MNTEKIRNKTHKILVALACVTAITTGIVNSFGAESKIQLLSGVINVAGGVLILGGLVDGDCRECHQRQIEEDDY